MVTTGTTSVRVVLYRRRGEVKRRVGAGTLRCDRGDGQSCKVAHTQVQLIIIFETYLKLAFESTVKKYL